LRDRALAKLREDGTPHFEPQVPYEKFMRTGWRICVTGPSRANLVGHQIPAWYTADGQIIVARSLEEAKQKAGTDELTQDPDVLDTWFLRRFGLFQLGVAG